jgi:hypothetical protein
MSFKVRGNARQVNVTAVICRVVTEALYKWRKMRVLVGSSAILRGMIRIGALALAIPPGGESAGVNVHNVEAYPKACPDTSHFFSNCTITRGSDFPLRFTGGYILLALDYWSSGRAPAGRDGAHVSFFCTSPNSCALRIRKADSRRGRRGKARVLSPSGLGLWANCIRGGLPWILFLYVFFLLSS